MTTDPEGFERVMATALGKAVWHSLELNERVRWLDGIRRALSFVATQKEAVSGHGILSTFEDLDTDGQT